VAVFDKVCGRGRLYIGNEMFSNPTLNPHIYILLDEWNIWR